VLGNQRIIPNVWRGIIDTRAPRLTLVADPTGNVSSNGRRFELGAFKISWPGSGGAFLLLR
jgi:hypothetical protein